MVPRDFLRLAQQLSGGGAASVRTAISRAYYAAHHTGVEVLEGMGFAIPRNPQGHNEVLTLLNRSRDPDIQRTGNELRELYGKRIRADYRFNKLDVENPKTAAALVAQADKLMLILEACRSDPRRQAVKASIEPAST
jgi:uncharacterized protein (UPF0332 family)